MIKSIGEAIILLAYVRKCSLAGGIQRAVTQIPVAILTEAVEQLLLFFRAEEGHPAVIPDAPRAQLQDLLGCSLGEQARTHHSLNSAGTAPTKSMLYLKV